MRMAARQHGVFSRRQWLDGGLSERQLHHTIGSRDLFVVHPGVYAVRGFKATFAPDVMAACLATGGVASHRCAAYLWKFRRFERPAAEVLVPTGHTPKLAGVTVRRTGLLDTSERTRLGVLPVTSRARTLLDLVSLTPQLVEGALDGTLHRKQCSLRATESELEDDLLAVIRRYGLPDPVPQYPYRGRRIDFAYPELVIGIEANGVQAHAASEDVQRNAEKANDLVEWWILYFVHDDVHGRPDEVFRRIDDAIRRRAAPAA